MQKRDKRKDKERNFKDHPSTKQLNFFIPNTANSQYINTIHGCCKCSNQVKLLNRNQTLNKDILLTNY